MSRALRLPVAGPKPYPSAGGALAKPGAEGGALGEERSIFDRLRVRGEEVFTQLSGELMANPHFMRAMEGALRGKEFVDQAVARALKTMNVPTRGDLKKVLQRIETLEAEVAGLKKRAKAGAGARKAGAARGRRTGPARG
jgi:hypothetical protein